MKVHKELVAGRFVFTAEDCGVTAQSLVAWHRHKGKVGKVKSIEVRAFPKHGNYLTYIAGTEATLILSGLTIGYSGEGPHGLYELLKDAGFSVPMEEVTKETFEGEFRVWEAA